MILYIDENMLHVDEEHSWELNAGNKTTKRERPYFFKSILHWNSIIFHHSSSLSVGDLFSLHYRPLPGSWQQSCWSSKLQALIVELFLQPYSTKTFDLLITANCQRFLTEYFIFPESLFQSTEVRLTFHLRRRQFPVRLAFGTTINE